MALADQRLRSILFLWEFRPSTTSEASTNSMLRWLRIFGTSGFLTTSHFKSPEAHFPEGLDRLPAIPFKIKSSYSLRGLFIHRYTSRKFALPNSCEPLIWNVPRISADERLKMPFAYASIPKQTAKKVALVFMVVACVSKDLGGWWRARENRRTNDKGKLDMSD
jgi:hypothetical protein